VRIYFNDDQFTKISDFQTDSEMLRNGEIFNRSLEWYMNNLSLTKGKFKLKFEKLPSNNDQKNNSVLVTIKDIMFEILTNLSDHRLFLSRGQSLLLLVLNFIEEFPNMIEFLKSPHNISRPNWEGIKKDLGLNLKHGDQ
jgi:hypothetical protein